LIAPNNDPLTSKNLIKEEDLYGRILMVGGGSPLALKAVQHRLIASGKIEYFNSPDHDTTLTNVAAGKGICLAPLGFHQVAGKIAITLGRDQALPHCGPIWKQSRRCNRLHLGGGL
jgi:hypothetical protein